LQVDHSLLSIQAALKEGSISCEQLVQTYLQRIEQRKELNAYLEVFATEALEKARMIDQKIAAQEPLGKLYGMVLGIKDVLCYKAHKVSAGSKMLENFVSLYSATSVERLLAEDVIILGRLNCDEFAMGLIAYASSFDQVGIFAKNMEEVALLLEIMAGKDVFDSTSSSKAVEPYSQQLAFDGEKQKKRIAYFENALIHKGLDREIRQQTNDLIKKLSAEGHEVKAVNFPYLDQIVATYYVLTTAESSSNLARYDGIHYGYRSEGASNMEATYKKTRTIGFGKEVQRRIMLGTFVLSSGYYDAYYAKAQKVRRMIGDATQQLLQEFDFLLLPTTPTTAFDIGDKAHQDPVSMYLEDIFTVQANLTGIPAISIPLFQHSNKLPFGLQLMGNKFEEGKLLSFAKHLLEQHNCIQKATLV